MDEREVAQLFIAEMRALLPIVQRHLDTLSGAFTTDAQRLIAGREVSRLSTAMADLSSGFHAEDCAFLAAAIAIAYEDEHTARLPSMALLAATADILTYLHARMQIMADHSRVLAPNEAERVAGNRLLAAFRAAQQRVTRELPDPSSPSPRDATSREMPVAAPAPAIPSPIHESEPVLRDTPDAIPAAVPPAADAEAPETLAELAHDPSQSGTDLYAHHNAFDGVGYDDTQLSNELTDEDRALLEIFRRSDLLPSRMPVVTGPLPELHALDAASLHEDATPSSPAAQSPQQETLETLADLRATSLDSPTGNEPAAFDPSSTSTSAGRPAFASSAPSATHAFTAEDLDIIPLEMRRVFVSETTVDIQDLRRALLRYEEEGDESILGEIGRIAHKIKGNAATLNFLVFADLALAFEDILTEFTKQPPDALLEAASALVQGIDLLQVALDAVIVEQEAAPALVRNAYLLRDMLQMHAVDDAVRRAPAQAFMPPVLVGAMTNEENPGSSTRQLHASGDDREPLLRVDVNRLNDLMKHVSALALNRAALTQDHNEIHRLQDELEHSLARLSALSGDITDLHTLLGQSVAARKDDEAKDGVRSSSGRFGFNLFGLGNRASQQNDTGTDWQNGSAPAAYIHSSGLNGAGAYPAPGQRKELYGLDLERYTEVDHALRSLNEVVADVTTTSRTLRGVLARLSQVSQEQATLAGDMQHDVMRIRLVPLGELTPRLHFEVRRLRQVTNKKIKFTTSGEQTEIDRNISEALAEPLIQLIRNAILHGIESPHDRLEQGKPEVGSVWLHAYYTNSDAIIEVGDDGGGVNPFGLAGVAFAKNYIDAETARGMSYTEALDLMFLPGVSTFDEAQTLGGRGIGLDQVRTAIQQLKGTINVRSEQGKGSVFRIRVPISLSIVRSLHVRAGDQYFAVPFTSVQRTLSLSSDEILVSAPSLHPAAPAGVDMSAPDGQQPAQKRIRVERSGVAGQSMRHIAAAEAEYEEIPAFALADLLGFEQRPRDAQMALVIDLGRQRAALLINDVVAEQELVVQVLPKHLRRRSLRGAAVTPEGQLLLLLDVQELVTSALDGSRPRVPPRPRAVPQRAPTLAPRVLVVDDSVSIRGALDRALRRAGFEVELARDGIEALEMMLVSPPSVMVLDIEMPRLDGFELLSIVRGSPQFDSVHVVMLTSRAAERHRAHALSLGAKAYLIKPCPNDILVETIRTLLMEPAIPR